MGAETNALELGGNIAHGTFFMRFAMKTRILHGMARNFFHVYYFQDTDACFLMISAPIRVIASCGSATIDVSALKAKTTEALKEFRADPWKVRGLAPCVFS